MLRTGGTGHQGLGEHQVRKRRSLPHPRQQRDVQTSIERVNIVGHVPKASSKGREDFEKSEEELLDVIDTLVRANTVLKKEMKGAALR